MLILLFGLVFVAFAVVLAVRAGGAGGVARQQSLARIDLYGFGSPRSHEQANETQLRDRLDAIATFLGRTFDRYVSAEGDRELRSQLYSAGLYTMTPAKFRGYRIIVTASLVVFWLWLAALGGNALLAILGIAVAGTLGWVGPMFVVKRRAADRLDRIDYEMPELVDLLVTSVEGGLGFTGSLQLAARNFEGPLGEELRIALREQSMGLTMNEALANLLTRTDTPSVRSFVQAVVQGETLGVSIGKVLRDLAGEMRRRRRQAAEERAHKAGTKILFPLVLLIFPALFVVTLGPVLISIAKGLSGA